MKLPGGVVWQQALRAFVLIPPWGRSPLKNVETNSSMENNPNVSENDTNTDIEINEIRNDGGNEDSGIDDKTDNDIPRQVPSLKFYFETNNGNNTSDYIEDSVPVMLGPDETIDAFVKDKVTESDEFEFEIATDFQGNVGDPLRDKALALFGKNNARFILYNSNVIRIHQDTIWDILLMLKIVYESQYRTK